MKKRDGLKLIKPSRDSDQFWIEGGESFVFSPSHPNSSMALLPMMSKKAAMEDKRKFDKLITTFKKPNSTSKSGKNFIEFDNTYKPSLY